MEFDGYLKHFKPSQRYVEERQKLFADKLMKRFPVAGLQLKDSDSKEAKEEKKKDKWYKNKSIPLDTFRLI